MDADARLQVPHRWSPAVEIAMQVRGIRPTESRARDPIRSDRSCELSGRGRVWAGVARR